MGIVAGLWPIFLITVLGFLISRKLQLETGSLAKILWYILNPALALSWLVKAQIETSEILNIFVITIVLSAILIVVTWLVLYRMPYPDAQKRAVIINSTFMNTANYGLPVILFVLGNQGVERAIIFIVTQSLLFNSLGVYLTVGKEVSGGLQAIKRVFIQPGLYAVILAIALKITEIKIPAVFMHPIDLLGQAAIPVMIILLGIQLSYIKKIEHYLLLVITSFLRLLLAPVIAFILLKNWPGVSTLTANVIILEAAMPSAVNNVLLATEFQAEPELASSIVLVTTVLSFVTLSVLISLLS